MDKLFSIILLLITSLVSIISFKVYNSYVTQVFLIDDINNNSYNYIENVDLISTQFPEIGVTSINLNTIKASYFIQKKEFDKALELLNKVEYDPLGMTDVKKAEIFYSQTKYDSLIYYATKAYNKVPNNSVHVIWYLKALAVFNRYEEIIQLFNKIEEYGNTRDLYFYFATVYNVIDKYNEIILKQAQSTYSKYDKSDFKELNVILGYIFYGEENFKKFNELSIQASSLFQDKNYEESLKLYTQAKNIINDDSDINYNILVTYYYLEKYDQIIKEYSSLPENIDRETGKFEFLVARSLLALKRMSESCDFFLKAKDLGHKKVDSYIKNVCKN